jgi:hypothetical protein
VTVLTAILGAWLDLANITSASSSFTERRQASVERLRNGLVFRPVEPTTAATVAAADAWETVQRENPGLPEAPVEAILALVTTESYGETGPDGSFTPKYKDRLAWVITMRDVEVFPLLGWGLVPGPDGKARKRPKLTGCVARFLVDAVDGRYWGAWESSTGVEP